MEKIIQIHSNEQDLFCLTEDGKVYERKLEMLKEEEIELRYKQIFKRFWSEIKEEEIKDDGWSKAFFDKIDKTIDVGF